MLLTPSRPALFSLGALALGGLIAVSACSGSSDGGDSGGGTPSPPQNRTEREEIEASVSMPENETEVPFTFDMTGFDTSQAQYGVAASQYDGALFRVTQEGVLSFREAPDFENPEAAEGGNAYTVQVAAGDDTAYDTYILTVTVEDVDDEDDVRVTRLVTGLTRPLYVIGHPDGSGRLLIVEKDGHIELYDPGTDLFASPKFLDVGNAVSTDNERGLLGLALAPDFEASGRFYVTMSNPAGDTELRRYTVDSSNRDTADMGSAETLLTVDQPAANHNGGWIGFGPDGYLWFANGDGGAGDPDGNAQNPNTWLGAMLRLDVSGDDDFPGDPDRNYAIPNDNPFVSGANAGSGAPEVYAYGFRNPWRASFYGDTLIVGDVGQSAREEIDLIRPADAGGNYGWKRKEGTETYAGGTDDPSLIDPVVQYTHASGDGQSVTGGYVYTGPAAELQGQYIFGDFVSSRFWAVPFDDMQDAAANETTITVKDELTDDFTPNAGTIGNLSSFGTGPDGEIYIVDFGGEIYRINP